MKKIQSIISAGVLVLGTMILTLARADQSSPAQDLRGSLPSQAVILSQTTYNLRGNGQEDNLVYYRAGETYGMVVISPENRVIFQFERSNVDHLYFQGKKDLGVVELDPASHKPFIVFNNYSDALHSEFHVFQWNEGSFQEVSHPQWGNNPQVTTVDGENVVVADHFGSGVPEIFQYRQDQLVKADSDFPFFFDPYVQAAWKSLEDPVLNALPGALAAQAQYLPAFLYARKASEGLQFADRLLQSGSAELTPQVLSFLHTGKGNLLMALGRNEEGFSEYQAADSGKPPVADGIGAGTFLQEAAFYESMGENRRAVLAYEKALGHLGQNDPVQENVVREKIDGLLAKLEGRSAAKATANSVIDLAKPFLVTASRM
jgi:tetratricopeptide (TPR) repeat protein